jgi:hypothetical protein
MIRPLPKKKRTIASTAVSENYVKISDKGMNTKAHNIGTPEAYSGSSP